MGAGLALCFKQRYPDAFASYRYACASGQLLPGLVHVAPKTASRRFDIVHLPTKVHWREAASLNLIERGLQALAEEAKDRGYTSISLPRLGCGLGRLLWADVQPRIIEFAQQVPDVEVRVCTPSAK